MKINKIFCDGCSNEIINCECHINQMRFILHESMDNGLTYEFCGAECLKSFVANKEFENRFYKWRQVEDKTTEECRKNRDNNWNELMKESNNDYDQAMEILDNY